MLFKTFGHQGTGIESADGFLSERTVPILVCVEADGLHIGRKIPSKVDTSVVVIGVVLHSNTFGSHKPLRTLTGMNLGCCPRANVPPAEVNSLPSPRTNPVPGFCGPCPDFDGGSWLLGFN